MTTSLWMSLLLANNKQWSETSLPEANKAAKEKKESKESNHVQDDRPHGHGRGG